MSKPCSSPLDRWRLDFLQLCLTNRRCWKGPSLETCFQGENHTLHSPLTSDNSRNHWHLESCRRLALAENSAPRSPALAEVPPGHRHRRGGTRGCRTATPPQDSPEWERCFKTGDQERALSTRVSALFVTAFWLASPLRLSAKVFLRWLRALLACSVPRVARPARPQSAR
jgi:hypothetical protein